MRVFKLGMIVGRFQPIHKGHEKLINIGLNLCDKLIIFVGSSQESGTIRNPFNLSLRYEMINEVLKNNFDTDRIKVVGLDDLTNENDLTPLWGKYVLNKAKDYMNTEPNCIIYGKDNDIDKCFSREDTENITEIYVDRKSDNISATMVRNLILNGKKEEFKKYVDEKIYNRYDELKEILEKIYYLKYNS